MDDYIFDIMWKNDLVSHVEVKNNRNEVTLTKYNNTFGIQPFFRGNVTLKRVYDFISYRCFEKGRPDAKEILTELGLSEYNPWLIAKKTHGRLLEDYLWLKFPGENLTWEDLCYEQL